jgi:hypothetical protein
MRLSAVLPTRVVVSALGSIVVAVSPLVAEAAREGADRLAIAESVIAREEAASERAFDSSFRAKAKELLAALPLAELLSQTGEDGLGLSSLGDTQADLVYTPVAPCRIIDTRVAGGTLSPGVPRSFKVTEDTTFQGGENCGIPFGPATSAMINFVAVNAPAPGDLRVTPFGTPMPEASILNWAGVAGLNLANGVAVALCDPATTTCTNDITLQADASAINIVADVQGYYQRVSTGGVGTALLADGAVTAPKIGSGVVVRSLNGLTDAVTLAGSNGLSVTQGSGTVTVSSSATAANTPSTIVARDGSGNFSAGSVALAGNLGLPNTSSATAGVLTMGGTRFLHNFGSSNTFLGRNAGNTNITGSGNAAVGSEALRNNTTGHSNGAFGSYALAANTTGWNNSGFGEFALAGNTTGSGNSAFGATALAKNTTSGISAFGEGALQENTTGMWNAAFGWGALKANTTAPGNSGFGYAALSSNTTGEDNSAFGAYALLDNVTGRYNSAFGFRALYSNTIGNSNTALGDQVLYANTTGDYNSAFGYGALTLSTTGSGNIALGYQALSQLSSGNTNIAIGMNAGAALTSGSYNIYIGDIPGSDESGMIRIGSGVTTSDTYIAGIYARGAASGAAVYVSPNGKLGTSTSSRRYKEQIADMDTESEVLMQLRPVSFYYRSDLDETHLRQYGLVAEEVAEVAPGLVAYDSDGVPQLVRYHFVNAMLLNEVQKQRRLVEEQRATIERQESKIRDLDARLARLEAARGDQ